MKLTLAIFFSFFLSAAAAQQPTENLSLNGDWAFRTDPAGRGEALDWQASGHNNAGWDSMSVPGNWDLKNEYAHYVGKAWYKKNIVVPAAFRGSLVRLLFEAVNGDSKVWLNGQLLGSNDLGYLPFEFDVSSILHYGAENTVAVLADNTFRIGALWNWGGIRRPVKLVASAGTYISHQLISPSVDLKSHTAEVSIRITCRNTGTSAQRLQGEVLLSNGAGLKKSLPFSAALAAGGSQEVVVHTSLNAAEVHLWSCDDPYLYQCQVSLKRGTETVHQVADRFGLRRIELDNKNYALRLNGEPIRPMGFNLVPDDRTTGNTLPLWRVKEDIDLMKSMGGNMARLTHVPLHKEMFDYLDEKGILVFSEIPLWGFDQLVDASNPVPQAWLKRLVSQHFNHPCIAGWSAGNEIGDSPGVMEYVDGAIRYIRTLDTGRLAVMISHTAYRPRDPIQYSDIGFINRYGTGIGMQADNIHQLHPEKTLFYSEFGYNQLREDLDADVDAKGMMDSIRFKPYLIGGALWTFNDYRSSFVGTKEFSENRPWGIIDVFRQKKQAWYSFQKEYAPVREVQIEFTQGLEGTSADVIITPRKTLDLPAYVLRNYSLAWEGFDDSNHLVQGGFFPLPVITPGDGNIRQPVSWKKTVQLSHIVIKLISPLNYTVYDTTIYFKKPQPPAILFAYGGRTLQNDAPAGSGSIRIVFTKREPHAYYKARYGLQDLSQETPVTLNSYIDIPKLSFGATYQVALVGVNGAGESAPSEISRIQVGPGLAPPLVYYTEPASRGFFIGYATAADDYQFIVQYTDKSGDYTHAATVQTGAKGVLFVPGLENGHRYYFRMMKIKDNNYSTGWSEEHSVVPDGGQPPPPPGLRAVLRNGREAMICFSPVKKATGYTVQYRRKQTDAWTTETINAAQITEAKISGLAPGSYAFRMASMGEYGQSAFTDILYQ